MTGDFPPATYAFEYRRQPVSGNTVNGVGVAERVRPRQVFHGSGRVPLEWTALEQFFVLTLPFRMFVHNLWTRWTLRDADGPIAPVRREGANPATRATELKAIARQLGAGLVGIAQLPEYATYAGYEPPYRTAISIACPMDHAIMREPTSYAAGMEVMRAYREITRVTVGVARHIRTLGYRARAYGEGSEILHIPVAIDAGVGELGKHGSLICAEFGSNFRLATVLTEMPLALDAPIDIGVEDLCRTCQRCTFDCPPGAIGDTKQMVRGYEKWYVDFDRCVPYFTKTYGCGICIEVCPWTASGRGPKLSQQLLARRARAVPTSPASTP